MVGGAHTCIQALLDSVGQSGTLVVPAFSPAVLESEAGEATSDDANPGAAVFDPATTPTSLGAIPEAFRTWAGVVRSEHPHVSVCAKGVNAGKIVAPHDLAWGQGAGSPFERLYEMDARLLLLGVGFNRATLLHYAESRVPHGRRKTRHLPVGDGEWVDVPDVGDDLDTHFPAIGRAVLREGLANVGRVGEADCALVSSRLLVDRAVSFLSDALSVQGGIEPA